MHKVMNVRFEQAEVDVDMSVFRLHCLDSVWRAFDRDGHLSVLIIGTCHSYVPREWAHFCQCSLSN